MRVQTIPITGGTPTERTSTASGQDRYGRWAPDGSMLVFERQQAPLRQLFKVSLTETNASVVGFFRPTTEQALEPSYSPDSLIVVASVGPTGAPVVATLETHAPEATIQAIKTN